MIKTTFKVSQIADALDDNENTEVDSLFILNKRVSLTELTKETHFTANELKVMILN